MGATGGWHMTHISGSRLLGMPQADWSCLNTSLYAVPFLAHGGKGGLNCSTCMGSDHAQQDRALFHLQSRTRPTLKQPLALSPKSRSPKHRSITQVCYAWNCGECRYILCKYQHTCAHCSGDHPITRCSSSSAERESKGPSLWDDRERFAWDFKSAWEGPRP